MARSERQASNLCAGSTGRGNRRRFPRVVAAVLASWAMALQAGSIPPNPDRFSEPLRFQHYGIAQGLSQSSVTALAEDTRGFLWVGTQDGLNRFDGYEFRRYRPDPDRPLSLRDAAITALAADPDGSLWVGTLHGRLARYVPRHDAFLPVPSDREDPGSGPFGITAIAVAADGNVWVGSYGGLARVASSGDGELELRFIDSQAVASLRATRDGRVWVGRQSGRLEALAADERRAAAVALVPFPNASPVRALAEDPAGDLWVLSDGADLVRMDADGVIRERRAVDSTPGGDSPRLRSVTLDEEGRVWIGGLATGLLALDPRDGRSHELRRSAFDRNSLNDDDVVALHRDARGTLWVGTLSGGLNRLRLARSGFVHHWHRPGDGSSLSHDVVTSFALHPDGALWVGTDGGGLNRLDPGKQQFQRIDLPGDAAGKSRIWSLHADRDGGLWAGTWGAGLHHRPADQATFRRIPELQGRIVTTIAEDDDGLWIGSADAGLERVSRQGTVKLRALEGRNVTCLKVDRDELWIGLWTDGLIRLSRHGEILEHLTHVDGDPSSLPHDSVRDLAPDAGGALWVATGAGIARLDGASRRFKRYGASAGLPDGTAYGIEVDYDGRLWVSTNNGLARFDPRTREARQFAPEDGLQGYEFTGGATLRLADGRLLFGGVHGFNLFDPRDVVPAQPPGRVELVEILLANEPIAPRMHDPSSPFDVAATEIESVSLAHRDNLLAFRFASPLSATPGQITYAYRLEGFDPDWRHVTSDQRIAVYTHLPPGRYTLRLRARDGSGAWSAEERIVALRIRPPWWASIWASLAYALAAAIALVTLIRWRTHALRQRSRVLRAQVAERTAQLSAQNQLIEQQAQQLQHALETKEKLFARVSHEFRTPLTLILGPIESLLADEHNARTAAWLRLMRRSARRLLVLVDQLLGLARLSGEAPIEATPQRIAPVLRGTVAAFDSAAAARDVKLSIDRLDDAWALATPEALERIVANLVSNAVKYTIRDGHVRASVRVEGTDAVIVVADDGPGIAVEDQQRLFEPFQRGDAGGEGTGLGLALVMESAVALGGSVSLDSVPGQGATFTVRLPACPPPPGAATPDEAEDVLSERLLLESAMVTSEARQPEDTVLAATLAEASPADDRPRVLIVEDNADLRALLIAALSDSYRCSTAADGRLGVERALDDPPELVISDVMMPGLDGFGLTQALKRDERTSHVPVVLLTALGDRDSRLHGLEEHADDYLVKPFDADELRLRVRNLIEAREIARQQAARGVYDTTRPIADTGAVDEVAHGPRERAFLERLRAAALRGHPDAEFGVAELANRVAMSERQLQRKLRALLGVSPAEYLRELRLQQAAERLLTGQQAANVAMDVGFASPSHFGACFKARFGVTPGEFRSSSHR
jgi:signal transduction histidine kinase/ligand-binding sensor domain-containing protein/DNA-binding response OmpR family regulator